MKTTSEIIQLAGTGVKIIINANDFETSEIISIVGTVGLLDSHILIKNASSKSNSDLLMNLTHYSRNITLEL
jgi:hypothetical protein